MYMTTLYISIHPSIYLYFTLFLKVAKNPESSGTRVHTQALSQEDWAPPIWGQGIWSSQSPSLCKSPACQTARL